MINLVKQLTFISMTLCAVIAQGSLDQTTTVAGYPCNACHIAVDWTSIQPSAFDHQDTDFPLSGSHLLQDCSDCHMGTSVKERHDFASISDSCADCHLDIHE